MKKQSFLKDQHDKQSLIGLHRTKLHETVVREKNVGIEFLVVEACTVVKKREARTRA